MVIARSNLLYALNFETFHLPGKINQTLLHYFKYLQVHLNVFLYTAGKNSRASE